MLTDDNFSTIAKAVYEGRTVYDNIVKSIMFILPTNLAEAAIIIVAIIAGRMLPITPAQILWINMVTAITLALALACEAAEPNIMERPPRPSKQGLITVSLLTRMLLVGLTAAVIVFWLFSHYRNTGHTLEYTRTVAVNSLVIIEAIYLLNCRFLRESIFTRHFFHGLLPSLIAIVTVIAIQCCFSYLPVSQKLFGLASLSLSDWGVIVAVCTPIMIIVEAEKFLWRQLSTQNNQQKKFEYSWQN